MELRVVYLQDAESFGVGEPVPKYGAYGLDVDVAVHQSSISMRMWQ